MAISFSQIFTSDQYSSNELNLLNAISIDVTFNPSTNYIEYIITDSNNSFKIVDEQYNRYSFPTDGTVTSNSISSIDFDPLSDIQTKNLNVGDYITHYNFFQNEADTTPYNKNVFLKEISSDRTEVVVGFINLSTSLQSIVDSLKVNNSDYFKEFYLNFGNGVICLANNIQISSNNTLTINLYEPLPSNINVNASFWIVTKIADTLSFAINITPDPFVPTVTNFPLKGPNFNLSTQDQVNNSTGYLDYNTLLQIQSVSSSNQIKSLLSSSGININIDYTDFKNFVHFSSAYQRLENFYYKVSQIESLNNQINSWSSVTNSSSSINNLQSQITSIITNFDNYDYYLYYNSSSWAWPKSNSALPYTLYSTGSAQVINWLGSGENLTGILGSASLYDERNQDSLYYSIPAYIRDDERNAPYYLFIEMMGQHYDNIWTYYKDVTNLHLADNRLDYGISKDLVAEALKSFGLKIYQNNFTSDDLYLSFLGYTSNSPSTTGSLPVSTNSFQDYINNYVTASYEASVNPLDDYNKEIYKRIYHNLPYLSKTKGTIPGLRALINCFGIPDTVLRISEFGGRDKDISTYDYFDQQFNYALDNTQNYNWISSSFILNPNWGAGGNRPESIQFRIKPYVPSNFDVSTTQSIFEISGSTDGYTTNLILFYTGSGLTTSSYGGSTVDPYYQYGTLTLDIKGNLGSLYTCSIYAPFFDGNWWSIMVNRSGSFGSDPGSGAHTFTLFAGSTGYYDGYDGNQIMNLYSSSTPTNTPTWGYSGSKITFFDTPINVYYSASDPFIGYAQEIRYWAATQSINSFKDYVMNPQSIDYSGENTYSSKLAARLPLGGDLYIGTKSVHPKVSGSWDTTSSFGNTAGVATNSNFSTYKTLTSTRLTTNVEPRFLNSPIVGLRGRVTDKIQIVSSSLPTGSVLSQYTSIEQSYPSLGSESPDVNLLEVAFSPQNEVNDDIIDSLGYFNIGEYIGDPRQVSSSATSYPDLNALSNNFFQKYFDSYDLNDYVRLIKYFDNSLFKMIKDFVPARTSLTTGVVIKQHLLERNKYPQPQVYNNQFQNINVYSSSAGLYEVSNYGEDLTYEGTIDTAFMSGGTGGTFDQYNILNDGSSSFEYGYRFNSSSAVFLTSSYINYLQQYPQYAGLIFGSSDPTGRFAYENGEIVALTSGIAKFKSTISCTDPVNIIISSSINGIITSSNNVPSFDTVSTSTPIPYIEGERFSTYVQGTTFPSTITTSTLQVYNLLPYSNQTWPQYYTSSIGISTIIHSTQDEFYNGELPGTEILVTTGELNPDNQFKAPILTNIYYIPTLYNPNITPDEVFLNTNTSPNPGEIYFWKGSSLIKINRIDANGVDQSALLSQLQSISVNFDEVGNTISYITSIQPQGDYYLYYVGQQSVPNDIVGNINDYSFLVSTSSYYAPLLTDPLTLPSNFNLLTGNTLNYFNTSSGVWTLGDTPNQIIQIQVSGNADIAVPTNLLLRVQANDTLIGSAVLLASGPGSGVTFNTIITFSSSFYHPIENDNIYIGLTRQGGGSTSILINNLYISASLLDSSSYNASSSLVIFNPSIANFDYNDYNPLLDNAETPQSSVVWMDIDYSQNPLVPVNFRTILNNSADRAFVQDSNYSSKAWSNLRYNGSRTNSFKNI
jgi:hypothetical protein